MEFIRNIMAKPSLSIISTGSIVDSTSKIMLDTSKKNTNKNDQDPLKVDINVNKPSIAKLTAEALNTTASFVEKIGTEETKDDADIF